MSDLSEIEKQLQDVALHGFGFLKTLLTAEGEINVKHIDYGSVMKILEEAESDEQGK